MRSRRAWFGEHGQGADWDYCAIIVGKTPSLLDVSVYIGAVLLAAKDIVGLRVVG